MKICIVTSVHPPNDPRLYKLCKSVRNLGHEVSLISSWQNQADLPGVKFFSFDLNPGLLGRLKNMKNILSLLKKANADVYHFHDLDLLPMFTFYHIFSGKTVIYDVHENYSEEVLVRYWIPNLIRIPTYYFVKVTQKICSRIIKNCIVVANDVLKEINVKTKHILIHKNYASVDVAQKRSDDYEARDKVIIFTGSQYVENGTLLFIEIAKLALNKRNDLIFQCIDRFGNNSSLRERVYAESNSGILKDRFILLPNVPSQDLLLYLNKSRIGISPNLNVPKQVKAIPTKLFEYMSSGLPIVASNLPNNKFYVEDTGVGFLANPDNPESFVDRIFQLLDNPEQAKMMGEKGIECFYKEFSWESQEQSLNEFYHRVAKG